MIPMDFDWLAKVLATDYQGGNQTVKKSILILVLCAMMKCF